MNNITDMASAPQVAIPITSTVAVSNVLAILPDIVNILTAVYLVILIGAKLYSFWKERKNG